MSAAHRLERFARRLHDSLTSLEIPVVACHPEEGPGQLEITIGHAAPVLTADRTVLLKHATKALAAQEGLVATFMAKPEVRLGGQLLPPPRQPPRGRPTTRFTPTTGLSPAMGSFIAGTLEHMSELTAVMAPTVNSYRRFVPHSWAATTATWAIDNRTAGLRAVATATTQRASSTGRPAATSIRTWRSPPAWPGASTASSAAAPRPLPPRATSTPTPERTARRCRGRSSTRSIDCERSELAADWLGPEFVAHFVAMRRAELAAQAAAVTDWETARYLLAL